MLNTWHIILNQVFLLPAFVCARACVCACMCVCVWNYPVCVGPCHHVMARPQVADGGTASDMEGSCQ